MTENIDKYSNYDEDDSANYQQDYASDEAYERLEADEDDDQDEGQQWIRKQRSAGSNQAQDEVDDNEFMDIDESNNNTSSDNI